MNLASKAKLTVQIQKRRNFVTNELVSSIFFFFLHRKYNRTLLSIQPKTCVSDSDFNEKQNNSLWNLPMKSSIIEFARLSIGSSSWNSVATIFMEQAVSSTVDSERRKGQFYSRSLVPFSSIEISSSRRTDGYSTKETIVSLVVMGRGNLKTQWQTCGHQWLGSSVLAFNEPRGTPPRGTRTKRDDCCEVGPKLSYSFNLDESGRGGGLLRS